MSKEASWSRSVSTTSTETSSPSVPLSPQQSTEGATGSCHPGKPCARAPLLHQSTLGSSADDDDAELEGHGSGEIRLRHNSFQVTSTSVEVSGDVVNIEMVDYSYVKLAKTCAATTTPKHDYTYPLVDSPSTPPVHSAEVSAESSSHGDCVAHQSPPPAVRLPARKPRGRSLTREAYRRSTGAASASSERSLVVSGMRSRCVHCREMFSHDSNRPGSCLDAPDPARRAIDRLSCLCCARAVVYHCDVVGSTDDCRTGDEPCSGCDGPGCCQRWTLLAALSLVVPCLWCYLPLHACHRCCLGHCGGRHKAA